ncbi:unnamed protein product [Tetraodon nigroviridis]|uniref:(spotted green pufferfish) hypothetical protein n=1 Tax=Tetraodon nigroviridis TaxID=99883 RepID=Q4SNB5_TETNG|nr:unnamed protein product [Tetraodon nigroviridis]
MVGGVLVPIDHPSSMLPPGRPDALDRGGVGHRGGKAGPLPLMSSLLVLRLTIRAPARSPSSTYPAGRPSSRSPCPRDRCCGAAPPHSSMPEITPAAGCAEASGPALRLQVAPSLRRRDPTYPRATEADVANRLEEKRRRRTAVLSVF